MNPFRTKKAPGEEDFVDPPTQQPARLSRKNILALVLTVAGVILVLFFSSRRTPAPARNEAIPEAPDHRSLTPITLGGDPEPQEPSQGASWQSAATSAPPGPPRDAQRRTRYDEARQSRPLVHSFEMPTPEANEAAAGEGQRRYTVRQSTVIDAALETALHSARPGPVLARVVRPVPDSRSLRHVLIPAGTRLTGTMQPASGHHLLVTWTRMEFPDGQTHVLPALPAIESTGEHGLADRVNRHRLKSAAGTALVALLGGSAHLATAQTGSLAGAALALELSRATSDQVQRSRTRPPTITVRPGYRFLVYVTEDLHFEAPYR